MSELIQLPNKDLWRGHVRNPKVAPETDVVAEEEQNPLNRAMANVLKASKGASTLTCLWCGMQFDEKGMREHLKERHQSVLNPATNAELALASVKQPVAKE